MNLKLLGIMKWGNSGKDIRPFLFGLLKNVHKVKSIAQFTISPSRKGSLLRLQ